MSTAASSGDEAVERNGKRYAVVTEGRASILVPETPANPKAAGKKPPRNDESVQQVFYNPIQQFNRDLSVLAIKAYGQDALERKVRAAARRKELQNSKKRKRQELPDDLNHRPQKVEKLGETSTGEPEDGAPSWGTRAVNGNEGQVAGDAPANLGHDAPGATEEPEASGLRFRILDALSASGLRALRYAHELPFDVAVTANDLLPKAVQTINLNVEHNHLADKITVTQSDAKAHMYTVASNSSVNVSETRRSATKYDVIDLDPYGTAALFFDAAVQAVRADGGLLCVTCTDAGVWASNGYQEKAFALYGGIPMKGTHSHEAGMRIILHGLAASAARYGLAIEPLLSLSIDFYCRIFVRVKASPASVKFLAGNTMLVYNCDGGCGAWTTQLLLRNTAVPTKNGSGLYYKHTGAQGPSADPNCEHCGHRTHVAGPMYAGRMHSAEFIRRILDDLPQASTDVYKTTERIRGMLSTALDEVEEATDEAGDADPPAAFRDNVDPHPFFFTAHGLAKVLHCQTPGDNALRGALRGLGYRATRSHCKAGSIKTDAPWSAIWRVMREWVRQKAPVKVDQFKPGMPGFKLLHLGPEKSGQTGDTADSSPNLNGDPSDSHANLTSDPSDPNATPTGDPSDSNANVPDPHPWTEPDPRATPEVVFDERLGREKSTGTGKLVRYQSNPRENWGPMNKAKGS